MPRFARGVYTLPKHPDANRGRDRANAVQEKILALPSPLYDHRGMVVSKLRSILASTVAASFVALGCGDRVESAGGGVADSAPEGATPLDGETPSDAALDAGDASSQFDAPTTDALGSFDATSVGADIELVSVDISPDPATALEILEFAVSVENHGPEAAPHLLITFQLPQTMTLLGGKECTGGAGFGQCSLGALAAGSTRSTIAFLSAKQAGAMAIIVTAGGGTQDENTGNNTKSLTLMVE